MTEPDAPRPLPPEELGFERIVYTKEPPRATIRLNRPEVLNAFDFRPVQRHGGARVVLLVDDPLEAELLRRERARLVGLRHSEISTKVTVNGMPISIASFPLAANASERAAALKASMSAHSNSA